MKILIVDDDYISQVALSAIMAPYGECVCEANGRDAVCRFKESHDAGAPFDLIFMDIQMPVMDGQTALTAIRAIEREHGVPPGREAKAVMITCYDDVKNVSNSFFRGQASCYFVKPLDMRAMIEEMRREGLL